MNRKIEQDSAQTYLTRDGEVLDAIAYRMCGSEHAVHALLAANPQVARHPAKLPAGVLLRLPAQSPHAPIQTQPMHTVRLWT